MDTAPVIPESIVPHQLDYKSLAWTDYTMAELGQWVHLFTKRATHRDPGKPEKIAKDLTDAQNYLDMMQAKLNATKAKLQAD